MAKRIAFDLTIHLDLGHLDLGHIDLGHIDLGAHPPASAAPPHADAAHAEPQALTSAGPPQPPAADAPNGHQAQRRNHPAALSITHI